MIATVHLAPGVSIACAAVLAAIVGWYWRRLGRPHIPPPRRRVRRVSLALQLATLPALVFGLSFADPAVDRAQYVVVWSGVFGLLVLILTSALVDAFVSLRVERRAAERIAEQALAGYVAEQRRVDAESDRS